MVRRRDGFTLVEVLVALALFAIGVLGAMTTALLATRVLRVAEAHEAAVGTARTVLDSLLAEPLPIGGARLDGPRVVRWSVRTAGAGRVVELEVAYPDGDDLRLLRIAALHTPPAHRPGGEP